MRVPVHELVYSLKCFANRVSVASTITSRSNADSSSILDARAQYEILVPSRW